MNRARLVAVSLGVALATTACKEERSHRVAASYSSAAQRTERPFRAPAPPQQAALGMEAIPTEEDYEVRAAQAISDANLQAKLAELERELRL
ncbi:MAG TPA: hypothetical protein VGC79_16115 [Polyangiaceae bacterium]